jgi:hypothetical protein
LFVLEAAVLAMADLVAVVLVLEMVLDEYPFLLQLAQLNMVAVAVVVLELLVVLVLLVLSL